MKKLARLLILVGVVPLLAATQSIRFAQAEVTCDCRGTPVKKGGVCVSPEGHHFCCLSNGHWGKCS
jgi:hypothetical protein